MRIEVAQIFSQLVSFLIMLWVLKRFAWKPLLASMEERRNKIKSDFATIDGEKKEAEKLKNEYQEKLLGIEAESKAIIQQAIEEGRQRVQEIQDEAYQQARGIVAKAQKEIQKEIAKAKIQLKDEIIEMTLLATQKVIQNNLEPEKQKELATQFVDQMELTNDG